MRYLLKHEAKVICCDDNRLTPLMLAAGRGFRAICELLITQESGDSYDRSVQYRANVRQFIVKLLGLALAFGRT